MKLVALQCETCHEKAMAGCMLCPEPRFFCVDHWLAHCEGAHGVTNEEIQAAQVDDAEDEP